MEEGGGQAEGRGRAEKAEWKGSARSSAPSQAGLGWTGGGRPFTGSSESDSMGSSRHGPTAAQDKEAACSPTLLSAVGSFLQLWAGLLPEGTGTSITRRNIHL